MTSPAPLTLTEIAAQRGRGDFDATAYLEQCLARIARRDGEVQAFEHFDADAVRAQAAGAPDGPLAGIPVGVKDLMDTFDMPTGWGSPIYRGRQSGRDAGCVATLRALGALVAGKTVTTEFACFHPGKTRNPWNPGHTPGGSSQGSAAAVADGMLPLALGTQTAASIIRPAAFCGVVGYKSSHGAFDLGGVCALSQTLDSLGFFVRDVRDIALLRAAFWNAAAATSPRRPRKVALVRSPHWQQADAASRQAVEQLVERLSGEGVVVGEAAIGPEDGALSEAHKVVMAYEAARARRHEYQCHRELVSDGMQTLVETGLSLGADDYRQAMALRDAWRARLDGLFGEVDLVLTPSAAGEAPAGLDSTGDPLYSRAWTLLGVPAVHLPTGLGPAGLPVGVQLVGRWQHDDDLVAHAAWVQTLTGPIPAA